MTRTTEAPTRNPDMWANSRPHTIRDAQGVLIYRAMKGGKWLYFAVVGGLTRNTRHVTPLRKTTAQARQDALHYQATHADAQ